MNSKISYSYCDASNYKAHNECVINGLLSDEQRQTILNCLYEGEFFVPGAVGLDVELPWEYNPQDDHPYWTIDEDSFDETSQHPTVNISADALVRALYELVSAGVLQKRDCDGDAFELTAQERLKLIDAHNLQDAWKESGLAEWCEDEITRVMCMVGESSLGDRLADAQKKSEQLADSAKAINMDEYELMPSRVDGFEIYRKILRDENGNRVKGIWAATKDGVEPFHISYEQALGREPIDDSSIKRLARQLGEMLLP